MELTVKLEDKADISFLKKMLLQLKGVKSVEISEDETYSWDEIESSDVFKKVLEQSQKDFEEGRFEEYSDELMDSIFNKK
ncbi:hypothetical protein SAMN05421847_1811 [Halpernia humi]|uniref:Uncharacterized protein n=1 Tax=Halpernia humi TaxID=493375 RepID=A0A1H5YQP6_9FLAO|nr:hypothetical protein [Halpernia humi]SEG26042.1 hypothetical protein SAMN05421847_1811 [Halpernia humi]